MFEKHAPQMSEKITPQGSTKMLQCCSRRVSMLQAAKIILQRRQGEPVGIRFFDSTLLHEILQGQKVRVFVKQLLPSTLQHTTTAAASR
mmetsp:Transcript_69799/g.163876  ORF Transcript_69799/g.163876 Transcript_69799/m.163876 type:complete len:89 (-) Transcript_69799:1043-1309(-)